MADTDKIGSWAEHQAIAHYLKRGFIVFRAVTAGSPVDLVVITPQRIRLLDVKYRRDHHPSGRKLKDRQIALGVEMIHVLDSGKVIDRADSVDPKLA